MGKKQLLVGVLCALVFAGLTASSALAGEVTGGKNPKDTPIGAAPDNDPHAASICSFSGQNDDPAEPGAGGRTQSRQAIRPLADSLVSRATGIAASSRAASTTLA